MKKLEKSGKYGFVLCLFDFCVASEHDKESSFLYIELM